jgi:hypothetical protein
LKPIVRGPRSTVKSSWYPTSPLARFETTAASSTGNAAALTHALTVMLPVNCNNDGLPSSTKSFEPSNSTAPALRPVPHVAPFVNVPANPFPDASAADAPDPSLNAYAARTPVALWAEVAADTSVANTRETTEHARASRPARRPGCPD